MASSLVAFASSNSADGALTGWTNPTYAYNDDGVQYATREGTSKNTWYGTLFGFDLSTLPNNARLISITLEAQWHNSAADTSGPVFYLGAKSGGSEIGTADTDTTGQVADELLTHSVTGITVADLKATGANGFWAIVRFRRTDNTAHVASMDYVKVTVEYSNVLVVADASQDQAADNVSLTQHQIIVIQNAAQEQSADNIALVQHQKLVIQDASQDQVADNVVVTAHDPTTVLEIQDASQDQAADNLNLTQHQVLAVDDAAQDQAADNVDLTQHQVLVIQNASQDQATENIALTQHQVLAIDDASQDQATDNVILAAHAPGGVTLVIQDAVQNQSADNVTLATAGISTGHISSYHGGWYDAQRDQNDQAKQKTIQRQKRSKEREEEIALLK